MNQNISIGLCFVAKVFRVDLSFKEELNLPSEAGDIDKSHRIGKVIEKDGKKNQNVIVRFRAHASRYSVFLKTSAQISPNLTAKRNKLLTEAINLVDTIDGVNFVYTDIHGDTKVRLKEAFNGKFVFAFYSIEELNKLLVDMNVLNI